MKRKVFAALVIVAVLIVIPACTGAVSTPSFTPAQPLATSALADTPTATSATLIPTAAPANPEGPSTLQYIGHSATLITAPDGTRIVSDPYGANHPIGLAPFPAHLSANAVTVSHRHPDHNLVSAVEGDPESIQRPGAYQVGMVKITGYQGDHGSGSGNNVVFVFEIGEVKIVHLGAAGVVTQSDILAAMENADVIIVDIMGDVQHPLKEEMDQLLELSVRTIIPTHYSFNEDKRYYGSATLDEFLKIVPSAVAIVKEEKNTIQITPNMPEQLVILTPAANENQ